MKPQTKVLITVIILLGLVGLFYFASQTITNVTGKSILGWLIKETPQDNLDNFTKCLSVKGVKMYGKSTCHYCANQKALFGSSFQYINYIECLEEPNECMGLEGVPAWDINGEVIYGTQSLDKLAQLSGCSLNNS